MGANSEDLQALLLRVITLGEKLRDKAPKKLEAGEKEAAVLACLPKAQREFAAGALRPTRHFRMVSAKLMGGRAQSRLGFVELVDLSGQNEIALRQTVDLMRSGRGLNFSPGKRDVWMVPLRLGKVTYAIHKLECFAKVGKSERLRDVVFFDDVPPIDLPLK